MPETLVWWVMMQVVGLAALPLCFSLFHRLPDRGYSLSKPFALLGIGYALWILNIMRIIPNTTGGIIIVLLMFGLISSLVFWRRQEELLSFVRNNLRLIAVTEIVLFLTFITAAYLRSYVAEIGGTEKPMDFMFLNAVTRADHFPPEDAWLSGSSVSYYYFGYLLVSVMTRLAGLATSVGFNLGLSMIAAFAVTGAFGLVYNLTAPREMARRANEGTEEDSEPTTDRPATAPATLWRPILFGVVAGLLLAVMGNLEGILEWMAAHNVGSTTFWHWANIGPAEDPVLAYDSTRWYPDQHWFWWQATRILDHGAGIHEFPFFSFLLGDLHPHVMSIPFVLLTLGAALALLRSDEPLDLVFWLERPFWLLALAVMLGALAFMNTWDMPTMAFTVVLMALVRNRLLAERWSWGVALDTAGFLLPLFGLALLAYTPFFFGGFTSQASGFTAESGDGSGLFHMLLIWGPFAVIVLPYAGWRLARSGTPVTAHAVIGALWPAIFVIVLWAVWDIFSAVFGWFPKIIQPNEAVDDLLTRVGDRGPSWLTALFLSGAVALLGLAFVREVEATKRDGERRLSHVFALGIALTSCLLILGTEFFFIRDTFSSRMNTIFKLYYQSWLMLSVAGGFILYEMTTGWRMPRVRLPGAVGFEASFGGWSWGEVGVVACTIVAAVVGVVLTSDLLGGLVGALMFAGIGFAISGSAVLLWRATERRSGALGWRGVWGGGVAVVLLAAFVYPLIATYSRTDNFNAVRTIDGLDYLKQNSPDEYEAIQWLESQDGQPVIAEALGDDYSDGGRVSASTGLPTLLQWPGHQLQWRGTSEPQTGRPEDLQKLYQSTDPAEVSAIIQKYGITFVYLGGAERAKYEPIALPDMGDLFEPAFEHGEVTVYRVRADAVSAALGEAP
jgi:YYY domain-containing protein